MNTEPSELRKAKYYSNKLPLAGPNTFSRDFYFIDKHAVFADGKRVLVPDLELISSKAAKFAETAEYYGRDKMKTYLTKVITNSDGAGRFVFVLGGKSTGKSKLLSVLSQEYPGRVVAVNCRNGSNLTGMLRDELIRKEVKRTHGMVAARVIPPPMDVLLNDAAAASSHGRITVMIDDADIALSDQLDSASAIAEARSLINLLEQFTKQRKVRNDYIFSMFQYFLQQRLLNPLPDFAK